MENPNLYVQVPSITPPLKSCAIRESSLLQFSRRRRASLIDGAIGLVVRGAEGSVNARVINAAADIRVIGRSGVGYDNVDISAATARNIPVVYTPGVNARAIAEGSDGTYFPLV